MLERFMILLIFIPKQYEKDLKLGLNQLLGPSFKLWSL